MSPVPLSGRIESSDAREHEEVLAPWELRLEQLGAGQFKAQIDFVRTDNTILYRENWNRDVRFQGQTAADYFTFGGTLPGRRPLDWCRSRIGPGVLGLGRPGMDTDAFVPANAERWVLLVRQKTMLEFADRTHVDDAPMLESSVLSVDPRRLLDFSHFGLQTVGRFGTRPELLEDPVLRDQLETRILQKLLGVICSEESSSRELPATGSVRARSFRRAVDAVHGSLAPLRIPELASEAGVSQRALEYAFRDVLGMTPAKYLRLHRLNRTRRELQLTDPDRTVTEVAGRWHFTELGRFAVEYRKLFGESPRDTLRTSYRSSAASLQNLSVPIRRG